MTTIPLVPVESSNVAALGYDETTHTLAVQFRSGQTYHYDDVPPEVNALLWQADASIGSVISKQVRPLYAGTLQGIPEENADE